jgi:hypothetical protein
MKICIVADVDGWESNGGWMGMRGTSGDACFL